VLKLAKVRPSNVALEKAQRSGCRLFFALVFANGTRVPYSLARPAAATKTTTT
jgi:hypothetical protein